MGSILSCLHFPTCSGCTAIGIEYSTQLERKLDAVRKTLEESPLETFRASSLKTITASPQVSDYRNRVRLVPRRMSPCTRKRPRPETGALPTRDPSRSISLGLYRAGSHEVVDIPGCPVQPEAINGVVEIIGEGILSLGVPLYDEIAHAGDLRYVTVRQGMGTGQLLVGLVTRQEDFPLGDDLASFVMGRCAGVVGVVQNINPSKGNVVLGTSNRLLAGRDHFEELICGVRLQLGITCFFQINTGTAELAYRSIIRHLAGTAHSSSDKESSPATSDITLLDLYAGVGTVGLIAARRGFEVWAIEQSEEAVEHARRTAQVNGIQNVQFHRGLVEQELPSLMTSLRTRGTDPDRIAVVVNPPRKGLDRAVIEVLNAARPARIAYLSCAPRTCVRDLGLFERGSYRVRQVELFDMFPQTDQVETLAILERSGDTSGDNRV